MSPATPPLRHKPAFRWIDARRLAILGALFILCFFTLFSYRGLFAYFTFDDGTTVIACLRPFETPFWRDLLHILTVFTSAFRPLTTLFWRPLYAAFGFHPLPYRIVVHLLLMLNIALAWFLARALSSTREAAALTTLIFCYNAATIDLYYDTCLVGDVLCFLCYGLALLAHIRGRILATVIFYLLALDSKELAVTLPAILVIYDLLYRRDHLRSRRNVLLLAAMFLAGAFYLHIKVADMAQNSAYAPHPTLGFILSNVAHYLQRLLYLPENSLTALTACLILAALIALAAALRTRPAIFGVLFFAAALIPIAVIAARSGYAAYLPYFGLTLALGNLLAAARSRLLSRIRRIETTTAVALFLLTATLLGWGHMIKRMEATRYIEWLTPQLTTFFADLHETVPEFPPGARVLITLDPWQPDWGPMFLIRLLYHDNSIWVDRTRNMDHPPDLASYDLLLTYQPPDIELYPARFLRHPMPWELRSRLKGPGLLTASSPAHDDPAPITFTPRLAHPGQSVTVTIPGLANVRVNALYRLISGAQSTPHLVYDWCTLDASGSCTITAPSAQQFTSPATQQFTSPSAQKVTAPTDQKAVTTPTADKVIIDWIEPANQRWIFSRGTLRIGD